VVEILMKEWTKVGEVAVSSTWEKKGEIGQRVEPAGQPCNFLPAQPPAKPNSTDPCATPSWPVRIYLAMSQFGQDYHLGSLV